MGSLENVDIIFQEMENKLIGRFMTGVTLYTICLCFIGFFIPGLALNLVMLGLLFVLFFTFIRLASFQNFQGLYYKVICSIFFVATILMILNGLVIDRSHLIMYFFFPYGLMGYILPFILVLPLTSPPFIKSIVSCCNKLGIVFLFLLPLMITSGYIFTMAGAEMLVWVFASGCGFILLTVYFQKRKDIVRALVVLVIGLFIVTVLARRNIMITCAGYMAAAFCIYIVYNKSLTLLQRAISIVMVLAVLGFAGYYFMANTSGVFSNIANRATENTRDEAFVWYVLDMNENQNNWIFGKGFNGTFYSPGVEYDGMVEDSIDESGRDRDYRFLVESGYLLLILKGGITYLILYLLVLIPAVIKGFLFSNNIFVKGCAALIVLWLIDMAPFGLPIFMLRYFLVWFCVAICYSKKIRIMNDREFKKYIDFDKELDDIECEVSNKKKRRISRFE